MFLLCILFSVLQLSSCSSVASKPNFPMVTRAETLVFNASIYEDQILGITAEAFNKDWTAVTVIPIGFIPENIKATKTENTVDTMISDDLNGDGTIDHAFLGWYRDSNRRTGNFFSIVSDTKIVLLSVITHEPFLRVLSYSKDKKLAIAFPDQLETDNVGIVSWKNGIYTLDSPGE